MHLSGSSPYRDDGEVQLGQIVDDDDATCDAPNRDVYQYVEVKEYRMLLSQRREMPQLPQLGQIGDDSDAICDASSRGVYQYVEAKEHRVLLS